MLYWYKCNCSFGQWILYHYKLFKINDSNTPLLIKIGAITISIFLPTRNKFVYSCSIKIHASAFSKLLESIFCLLLVVEAFSQQEVVEMLEEVVVGWQEVRWIWWKRQNFVVQMIQLLKCWLCDYVVRFVMEKNWALSVDQCQLWVLQFSVLLIDLVRILLKCHDFTRIQKGVVDHTGSRLPNSDCDPFLVQVWLWEVLWSFSWSSQLAGCCWLSYKIHFSLHVTTQSRNGSLLLCRIREDNTSKW